MANSKLLNQDRWLKICLNAMLPSVRRHVIRRQKTVASVVHEKPALCRHFIMDPLVEDIRSRGLVDQISRPTVLDDIAQEKKQSVYAGIDPTAKSLHVGHLVPFMCLLHFMLRGHLVYPVIGGATGLIGDPTGRSSERPLMAREKAQENAIALQSNIEAFFKGAWSYAQRRLKADRKATYTPEVLNNLSWYKNLNLLDFLRDVGVHARFGPMVARDSVQSRMKSRVGLSFTEFTYQLLQGYDFYVLWKEFDVRVQIGGSDQYGNILLGQELVGKMHEAAEEGPRPLVVGITTPLLTTATGDKFGKSAGNAIWLNSKLTSEFDFYQFWLKTADADVEKYLKMFTLLPIAKIERVVDQHVKEPDQRTAQRLLADEVTELVHGENGVTNARAATAVLFGQDVSSVRASDVIKALHGDPRLVFLDEYELLDKPVTHLLRVNRLTESSNASHRLIEAGGLYLNGQRITEANRKVYKEDLIDHKMAILRIGKDKHAILVLK